VISLGTEAETEHIVLGRDRWLYAAVARGRIIQMNLDVCAPEIFAETDGSVLGFDFDATGNLIAAEQHPRRRGTCPP